MAGRPSAGHLISVRSRRIRFNKPLTGHREVLIVRCDCHILRHLTLPREQARVLEQTMRSQLKNLPLADFLDVRELEESFDEPNDLW